jgi:hypothetical protein
MLFDDMPKDDTDGGVVVDPAIPKDDDKDADDTEDGSEAM